MAISIKRGKVEKGIKLGTLKVGDTFLYDNRVGTIIDRNGHCFPIDLGTCTNFRLGAKHMGRELSAEDIVLPVEIELTYHIC